jgi:hypothetical protein
MISTWWRICRNAKAQKHAGATEGRGIGLALREYRTRYAICSPGVISPEDHRGALFWDVDSAVATE